MNPFIDIEELLRRTSVSESDRRVLENWKRNNTALTEANKSWLEVLERSTRLGKKVQVDVQCTRCGHWIETPIRFSDGFEVATLIGAVMACPACNKMTTFVKDNIRFREVTSDEPAGGEDAKSTQHLDEL